MAKNKRGNSSKNKEYGRGINSGKRVGEDLREEDKEFKLDKWQQQVLDTQGKQNLAIRAGRQVGKSTIISILTSQYAVNNPDASIMVVSATERQAYLLFSKILLYLDDHHRSMIVQGKLRPTKSEIRLHNGAIIRCLPTGLDGLGIRGYTTDLLIVDEAAFVPASVFPSIIPQLTTTGGKIILLSTPIGSSGYFYECFNDDDFQKWHISAEEVAESREEPQRTYMLNDQRKQKARMSKLEYAQEYLGEFIDDMRRVFSDELVRQCCVLERDPIRHGDFFLGVDIARMGDDLGTYEIIRKTDDGKFIQVESIVTEKKFTTETYDKIIELDNQYHFRQIGIDAGSGSLGVGILDFLLRNTQVKRKVIALNNRQRNLDHRGEKKRTLMKEDMYMNLLAMMEKGVIKLLNDDELIAALRAIQYEYNIDPKRKSSVAIFAFEHHYTDLVEGLIRAAWLANQKHINMRLDWV